MRILDAKLAIRWHAFGAKRCRSGVRARKAVHTGMLYGPCDGEEDVVELMADETLWDLYRLDHQVLVSLQILKMLPRAEVAQTLYLFFSSLPNNPVPVSFERLREQVRLETSDKRGQPQRSSRGS